MASLPQSVPLIRPMRESDLADVMDVELRAYPFPWTEGIFRDCIRVGYGCWVYVADGEVHGYAVMSHGAGEAHVLNVCVDPERQAQGIGETLMRHLLRQGERAGARQIFLEVRPSNLTAIRLYNRLQFRQVGCRRDYYPGDNGREDALVMSRRL